MVSSIIPAHWTKEELQQGASKFEDTLDLYDVPPSPYNPTPGKDKHILKLVYFLHPYKGGEGSSKLVNS